MVTTIGQLPPDLLSILNSFDSLESTATRFVAAIPNPADSFSHACDLLTLLDNSPSSTSVEDIAVVLNAEYVLYWLYREFDIRRNPFVTHWVEVCTRLGNSTGKPDVRVDFVKGILGGLGEKFRGYTPRYVCEAVGRLGINASIDLEQFDIQTGFDVNDDDPFDRAARATLDETVPGHDESTPILLLELATSQPLLAAQRGQLLAALPELARDHIPLSEHVPDLITENPTLAPAVITSILQYGEPVAVEDLLTTILPRLDLDLASLDCLNSIITPPEHDVISIEQRTHLLHLYISNSIRRFETEERAGQARKVKLLCLFMQNLLRKDVIDVVEFFYEFQEIGLRYIWVKEAREMWLGVGGGGESGG